MKPPKKILVIDDDPLVIEMMNSYLQQLGYTVLTAIDGYSGLELITQHCPDIILVDLDMPVVDGLQILRAMKKNQSDIPTIVISGTGEMKDVIQALHLGAHHYLTKPIDDYDILEHAIKQALEKAELIEQNKSYQEGLEKKLGAIIDHFPGYVVSCSPDFVIHYANQQLVAKLERNPVGEIFHQAILGQDSISDWLPDSIGSKNDLLQQEIWNSLDNHWYDISILPLINPNNEIYEYQIVLLDITERKQQLINAEKREQYLREENQRLLDSLSDRYRFGDIIGRSTPMQKVYQTIISAAGTDASVIIYGESGTGKELVAKSIHNISKRKDKPFISVNCGAIPESLIESEFFGYRKGAFSGAIKDKHGFLAIAHGGTLFLDEVGDIPISLQTKLLRAIEGGGFTPLGGTEIIRPNVRIISATNKDLTKMVSQGAIRQDFLYRIHIIPLHLPPLRERKEDLQLLIEHFLDKYDPEGDKPLPEKLRSNLLTHPWPGNVRELENTIQQFIALGTLDFLSIPLAAPPQHNDKIYLEQTNKKQSLTDIMQTLERQVLINCFQEHNWHQSLTAEALQIDRKTLYRKMKQHNISKPS